MDHCAYCRARREAEEICRRCGTDLSSLFAVEQAAEAQITHALRQLAAGEAPAALQTLTRARVLNAEPFIKQLLGFVQHLADDPSRPNQADQADCAML
ncbi:hypothetical protein [uncultured Thiodictyon sp.]|uniref:hypothetical protein n=1 Tax=uncultured Thiodictyon sp. TaxID=1846217 RepID=UPI0025CD8E4E|nr:hypothetical protein [uncultured Thiodictyon sp.]